MDHDGFRWYAYEGLKVAREVVLLQEGNSLVLYLLDVVFVCEADQRRYSIEGVLRVALTTTKAETAKKESELYMDFRS